MSKKNNDNLKSSTNNDIPASDTFSFLELNKYLAQENLIKINSEKEKEEAEKKKSAEKKETEKKQKLKIKPNANIAREQTTDDLMYIEKEDIIEKKEEKEEKKEEKKEMINNKEKIIPKKSVEKKKIDKRIVTINLEKEKSEEKSKNKGELGPDQKDSKNTQNEGYDINEIINKIKEKDPQAYTPIILPFENVDDEEKSLKENLEENEDNEQPKLFVIQFPRQIPIKDLKNQEIIKEEENVNEEPQYDDNGFLISPEFKNTFQEIKDNTVIGKLVIMKSGKVKIKMGDIYFDINQGSTTKFAQYSAIVTGNDENRAYILGQPFNKKLIVTPEFD